MIDVAELTPTQKLRGDLIERVEVDTRSMRIVVNGIDLEDLV